MKQYPPVLSRIFQLWGVIVWLATNAVLFVCLVWYPMTVGWYGISFPGLVEPVLYHMSRLVGWPLPVTATLSMFILEYSIAAAEGCLVGVAWAARP